MKEKKKNPVKDTNVLSVIIVIHINMDSASTSVNNVLPVLPGYNQTIWDTPEPIYTMDGKALIGVAKNTIILIRLRTVYIREYLLL